MEKNTFYSWNFFSTMHSFWVFVFFSFWKILPFFKFSQVAILKLEHCGLFYLVADGCLHNNSLYFWKWSSKLFLEKIWKPKIFENLDFGFRKVCGRSTKFSKWETKNTRFCFGINKLSNAKNRNVLPSKLRPVKTFKVEKITKTKLFRRASERWQTIGTASSQTEACDSRGLTRYYWLTFVPLPDVLPVVAW